MTIIKHVLYHIKDKIMLKVILRRLQSIAEKFNYNEQAVFRIGRIINKLIITLRIISEKYT